MRTLIAVAALAASLAALSYTPVRAEECTGEDCASQQQNQQGGHDCQRSKQIIS